MPTIDQVRPAFRLPGTGTPSKFDDKVEITSSAYDCMAERWKLLHDLLGGTEAMRAARTEWLPLEPKEESASYNLRISRSILFNAYADTIEKLTAKPFSRPVTVKALPPAMDDIIDDVDGTGRTFTQFGRDLFESALTYGLTHVLVDFPTMMIPEGATLADERAAGGRPNLIHVKPPQLIGWRVERIAGKDRLTQIRIHEVREEPVGAFVDEEVEYIRVYTRDSWQLWRKDKDEEEFRLQVEGTHTFGEIPLITLYFKRTGWLTAKPPLNDLAWLNLAHWQSLSDQRNILRFARVGILFGSGFEEEEAEAGGITVGANRVITTSSTEADLKYVEHSGAAIGAGERDLMSLQENMEVMGLAPLMRGTGNMTATGRAIDSAHNQTAVQAWVRAEEGVLVECLELAARWMNLKLQADTAVDIFNEFGLSMRATEDINALIAMRKSGEISRETFLLEIKRRGVLSESIEVDEEMQRLSEETPVGLFGEELDDDADSE